MRPLREGLELYRRRQRILNDRRLSIRSAVAERSGDTAFDIVGSQPHDIQSAVAAPLCRRTP